MRLLTRRVTAKKKFHVHDEKNEAKVGDKVRAIETKPISKIKRWKGIDFRFCIVRNMYDT